MSRLKIAVITSSFWPLEGGAERQLRQVLQLIVDSDAADVNIFTEPNETPGETSAVNLNVFRPPPVMRKILGTKVSFALRSLLGLLGTKPDVVLSSQAGLASLVGAVYSRLFGVPLVIRLAGSGERRTITDDIETYPLNEDTRYGRLLASMISASQITITAPAQHILTTIAVDKPQLIDNMRVINNGVERRPVTPNSTLQSPAKWDCVWYGRDDWVKNPEALIELAVSCPQLTFAVIGNIQLPSLHNLELLGWVDDPVNVICQSRIAVMTSRSEGSPNFALQALSVGVPVVGLRNPAMEELRTSYPEYVDLADSTSELARCVYRKSRAEPPANAASVPTLQSAAREWLNLFYTVSRNSNQLITQNTYE